MPSSINSQSQRISVGARRSLLSIAQVKEVQDALRCFHPHIELQPIWIETIGDKDLTTSLRTMGKTDFFTREIDLLQLQGGCRISIHSAKDLPEPLAPGLSLIALTQGTDPSDVLVIRENLPFGAKIGTSSIRRENNVKAFRQDLVCVDIRGSVIERLAKLDREEIDGIVMAEAALIRLGLTERSRYVLPGETTPLQGRLAVIGKTEDEQMRLLFRCLDAR